MQRRKKAAGTPEEKSEVNGTGKAAEKGCAGKVAEITCAEKNSIGKAEKTGRAVLLVSGGILSLNALCLVFLSNLHIGLPVTFLLGVIFLLYGFFGKGFMGTIPHWLTGTFFVCVFLLIAFIIFLLCYGISDNPTYQESAIIVLGSGIRGERVTEGLQNRLDAAVAYYKRNSGAVIVVSGGQGPQEAITEALAMERYLLSCGIPPEKIIKEERATSTYENFLYSKQLLDGYFSEKYTVTYVTNNYHIYRAGKIAQAAGFDGATHCAGGTPWYSVIPSCVRECIGVLKFWILGN